MTLVDKLTQWNGGELRGAASRLARKVGAAPGLMSMWLGGTVPSDKYMGKLSKELDTPRADLLKMIRDIRNAAVHGSSVVKDESPEYGYRFLEIPHLGTVSANRFTFSFDLPPENFTTLAIKGSAGERYAMLRISGDCMAPRIEDGDEVLIHQTASVADGSIAIVCFDGECTMKRIYRKKDGVELRADNPKYQPRVIASNKIVVLAEVMKIMKDPRRKP